MKQHIFEQGPTSQRHLQQQQRYQIPSSLICILSFNNETWEKKWWHQKLQACGWHDAASSSGRFMVQVAAASIRIVEHQLKMTGNSIISPKTGTLANGKVLEVKVGTETTTRTWTPTAVQVSASLTPWLALGFLKKTTLFPHFCFFFMYGKVKQESSGGRSVMKIKKEIILVELTKHNIN